MGSPAPLVIYVAAQRVVVGKTWFDPAAGEIKALLDQDMPAAARAIIYNPLFRREYSIVPAPAVLSTFERLMTTQTTHVVTDIEEG